MVLLVLLAPTDASTADGSVPLRYLLQELGRSGAQLIYSSETVPPDLRATPPQPDLPLEDRLRSLLAPSGLEAQKLPTGGYVIVRSSPVAATLEVTVTIEREGVVSSLSGAQVWLLKTPRYALTDSSGHATFTDLVPANYSVEVKSDGLRAVRRTVRIPAQNATTRVELHVTWEPVSLEEITIEGNRYDAGTTLGVAVTREALYSNPITSSDTARALQLLPGAAVAGYSAKTHVRGSRDDETLFRYDGMTVTVPYHLDAFQSLISAVDPAVTESAISWTGVVPIQFSGKVGAVVDIEPRTITRGTVDAKLSNREAAVLVGTPFDGARGTVFAAARLSNAYSPARWPEPEGFSPEYRDYVLRATWAVGPRTHVAAGMFAVDDERDTLSSNTAPKDQRARLSDHHRYGWIRLFHDFVPWLHIETLLSHESSNGFVKGGLHLPGIEHGFLAKHDRISALTVREEVTIMPASAWSLQMGAERTSGRVDNALYSRAQFSAPFVPALQPKAQMQQDADIMLRAAASSFYGGIQWQSNDTALADVGLRYDRRQYERLPAGDGHWSVRANFRQRLSEATMVRLAWGQTTQASIFDVMRAADGWIQPAPVRLLTQVNLSVEQTLGRHWLLRSALYDKRERSRYEINEDVFTPFALLPEIGVGDQVIATQGSHMRGFETRLESDRSRPLSGWLAYAWSKAEDKIAGVWVPRSWDQPNAVQLGARWREGPWQVSSLFSWHTGWPYTPLVATNTSGPNPTLLAVALGPRNSARLASFVSLDLRLIWEHSLGGGLFQASLELNDVTNSKAVCCQNYSVVQRPDGTSQLIDTQGFWLGFAPALGIRWQR